MISQINGLVVHCGTSPFKGAYVVLSVHGLGLECWVLPRALPHIQSAHHHQQALTVYTHLVVREDALQLVGFLSHSERDLFSLLQQASGVGVRTALALMESLSISELVSAIVGEHPKPLTAAKGVGPKLAQKLVLELKEKLTAFQQSDSSLTDPAQQQGGPSLSRQALAEPWYHEAESVLLSLGYNPNEIHQGLQAAGTHQPRNTETVLQHALQWLALHA